MTTLIQNSVHDPIPLNHPSTGVVTVGLGHPHAEALPFLTVILSRVGAML